MDIRQTQAKLDNFDAKHIREMIATRPFAIIRGRIEAELERNRAVCERAAEPPEIYRAQGAVLALRAALELPDRILKEIAAAMK